jgi:hypothetical protein
VPVPFFNAQSQRKGAIAPCSWTPEESQVESCEHQDNANIHCQPFPESVSEEHEIYTDYDGCHRHHVKHYSYLSAHFSSHPTKFTLFGYPLMGLVDILNAILEHFAFWRQ